MAEGAGTGFLKKLKDLLKDPLKAASDSPQMGGGNPSNDEALAESGDAAAIERLKKKKKAGAASQALSQ